MGYIRAAAVAGLVAVMALVGIASVVTLPIPPGVAQLGMPRLVGAPAIARPIASFPVPQHPHLARNGANSMHNDGYATDTYTWPGPLGEDPVVTSATYGIEECATLAFDRRHRIVALCGNVSGPVLKLLDPRTLAVLTRHRLPPRTFRPGSKPWEDLCGGAYFYLDAADRAVVATTNRQIHVVGRAFTRDKVYDLRRHIAGEDCLIAVLPDWAGRIWFVTSGGIVGMVHAGGISTHRLPGERIANSFAVDETGGVYVVSDHALYRFEGHARVAWRVPYDRGVRRKPGQLSRGSGTTPTLLGDDRIAITDNAEPRMHVLVYRRADGRVLCREPVFRSGASATENSLVAVGDSVIVENNYGYTGPGSTMGARTTAPGIARVDTDRCDTVWTSDETAPTSVPKASLATGLLYVYAKPRGPGWYLAALDLRTGETRFRVLTGTGVQWNNHYAAVTLGPDGSAYIATLAGMVRVRDRPSG